jgi:hypothetical protein
MSNKRKKKQRVVIQPHRNPSYYEQNNHYRFRASVYKTHIINCEPYELETNVHALTNKNIHRMSFNEDIPIVSVFVNCNITIPCLFYLVITPSSNMPTIRHLHGVKFRSFWSWSLERESLMIDWLQQFMCSPPVHRHFYWKGLCVVCCRHNPIGPKFQRVHFSLLSWKIFFHGKIECLSQK